MTSVYRYNIEYEKFKLIAESISTNHSEVCVICNDRLYFMSLHKYKEFSNNKSRDVYNNFMEHVPSLQAYNYVGIALTLSDNHTNNSVRYFTNHIENNELADTLFRISTTISNVEEITYKYNEKRVNNNIVECIMSNVIYQQFIH
jgi:hypothetical protein